MSDLEEFQTFLRSALKSRGWSVLRLADETKISDAVIYRWLRGVRPKRPSDANLKKLAPVLGISEEALLRMTGYVSVGSADSALAPSDPQLAATAAALQERWPTWSAGFRDAVQTLIGGGGSGVNRHVTLAGAWA